MAGCPQTEELCAQSDLTFRCWEHGICTGSMTEARCQCLPGWTGPSCSVPTVPTTFKPQSYVKYALSFDPDKYSTVIQLRFRTREQNGELFRVSDQHNREYGILEVCSHFFKVYFCLSCRMFLLMNHFPLPSRLKIVGFTLSSI